MIYLYSFLFAGTICLIGELLYLYTKITPGHITTLFVIIGAILGGIGVYDIFIENIGGGATSLIMNFGNLLVRGGIEGIKENGIFGMFSSLFKYTSFTLSFVIFISILFAILPKIKVRK